MSRFAVPSPVREVIISHVRGAGEAAATADASRETRAGSGAAGTGLYLALISIHGLIRGRDLELGRDADTGGQTLYVVELARALARHPDVARVDLLTRRVVDAAVSDDYAAALETIGDGAQIVRIDAGPEGYIYKEALWDHVDSFADNALDWFRQQPRMPDLVHSHYADAGYVGSRICNLLGLPLVHTGHSLGRVKRRRLLASGHDAEAIESGYNMSRRIEAEETTLATASRVITSTEQEVREQYELYDHYTPERMVVIPPGTDLTRFSPPRGDEFDGELARELARFLREPGKPLILAISRADPRKNIEALVNAYGESPRLQRLANLVIVAGNRDDINDLEGSAREVLTELLLAIDRHDLYGRVALPKQHRPDDVPVFYRMAAASGGVFVNPALTEPFGLTLIEAAASGVPIVATEDGGPRDIIANCKNGVLVDPLDTRAIAAALLDSLGDRDTWRRRARNGLEGARKHYAWEAHVERYLPLVRRLAGRAEPVHELQKVRRPLQHNDRALFTDLDQTLLGDAASLSELLRRLRDGRRDATFGIATGRRLDTALRVMRRNRIGEPDVLITSGGTAIHYAPTLTEDTAWTRHIDHRWTPGEVRKLLDELPGLELQPRAEQSRFKLSYYIDPTVAPGIEEIGTLLSKEEQACNVVFAFGQFLDVLPIRASKGLALRYVCDRWGIPLERVLVAGGSGADEDMLRGNTMGVVVANRHHEELSQLPDLNTVYFARRPFAGGILEAIEHYDFFATCQPAATGAAS